ncbi:MAG: hypothetical protein ACI4MR_05620 [Candidatus Aphodomorpha sp.]
MYIDAKNRRRTEQNEQQRDGCRALFSAVSFGFCRFLPFHDPMVRARDRRVNVLFPLLTVRQQLVSGAQQLVCSKSTLSLQPAKNARTMRSRGEVLQMFAFTPAPPDAASDAAGRR